MVTVLAKKIIKKNIELIKNLFKKNSTRAKMSTGAKVSSCNLVPSCKCERVNVNITLNVLKVIEKLLF